MPIWTWIWTTLNIWTEISLSGASLDYRNHVFAFHLILSDEPEHLHDPPLLKYIPHLWPGGGVDGGGDGAGVTVDHGGDSVGNGDYDGGELGMEVMVL